jgi:outer membrane protein TolC
LLFVIASAGCAGLTTCALPAAAPAPAQATQASCPSPDSTACGHPAIAPAEAPAVTPASEAGPPFGAGGGLSADAVVEQVLARNPSLAQMTAALQAALTRYPQVTSLDDPMVGATVGPATISPDDRGLEFAYRLEISQKYPWPGKRQLRGENALAEARAAGHDVGDMRLQLVESAKAAFYDYYLVGRALAVNEETLERLAQFRKDAEALYRTPPKDRKVSFQEVTQADVEIGRQQQRRLTLERMRLVAVARINTLMHLSPTAPLPSPPEKLSTPGELPDAETLRQVALARRPDLRALADRVAAEQAALGLAGKEYCPDFEAFVMYDRFMGNTTDTRDLATQVGVRTNLPVRLERRRGAVAEAAARLAQRQAELARQADQAGFQVQEAHAQAVESERTVHLYVSKILPDADQNVKTARADYKTGLVPAMNVVEAERMRLELYDRYYEAVADYYRRLATLERAAGGLLAPVPTAESATPCGR